MKLRLLFENATAGIYQFARSRWDQTDPRGRLDFLLKLDLNIVNPRPITELSFDELPEDIRDTIAFHLTKS